MTEQSSQSDSQGAESHTSESPASESPASESPASECQASESQASVALKKDLEILRALVQSKDQRIVALERSWSYRFGNAIARTLTSPIRAYRKLRSFWRKSVWYLRNRWRAALARRRSRNSRHRPKKLRWGRFRRRAASNPTPDPLANTALLTWEAAEELPSKGVRGNRWSDLEPPAMGGWTPEKTVSIILPHYRAEEALAITLAALVQQTYPRHLMQVIVADDGSPQLPQLPVLPPDLEVLVVTQPRRGYGLARARNRGADSAHGEVLVFLDCDMVPEPRWLEAHARWHHVVDDAVTLGFRSHVDFEGITASQVAEAASRDQLSSLFSGRPQQKPEWIEVHFERMKSMTSDDDDLFRIAAGGNLALRATTFQGVGGFDGSFDRWGAEDIEFSYRLFCHGALLIPERRALCFHQGLNEEGAGEPDSAEQRSLEVNRAKIAHLIAQPTFRRQVPGRSFQVPYAVVRIDVGDESARQLMVVIESVLASRFHDLAICLSLPPNHRDADWLSRQLGGDPRVRVGVELDDHELFPFAAVRVQVAPWLELAPETLGSLVRILGKHQVGVLSASLGESADAVRLTTTRAWRRASRLASQCHEIELLAAELFRKATISLRPQQAKRIRGSRESRVRATPPSSSTVFRSPLDIRAVNPIGFRAQATECLAAVGSNHALENWQDLVEHLPELAPGAAIDVFELQDEAEPSVGSLEKRFQEWRKERAGAGADKTADIRRAGVVSGSAPLIAKLRRYRAVVDHPVLHAGDQHGRAAYLSTLAGAGVPLLTGDVSESLGRTLGAPLAEALRSVTHEALADVGERERCSVKLRRAALSRALPRKPRVSILLALHRPKYLEHAMRQVRRQSYEDLELVVALHGGDFGPQDERMLQGQAGCPIRLLELDQGHTLGEVLNATVDAASGEILTKMDGDDWYGSDHVLDLVLALEYSGATLVGKAAEFVFLQESDATIRRFVKGAETSSLTLAGGSLMLSRSSLSSVGGWRDVPKEVDQRLIEDVIQSGGTVHRTHGFGYLLNRHGTDHTWAESDNYFLGQAATRRTGLDLAFAEID